MAGTAQDDGFHEIQLNGKQLVFLFMAATVVTVVIFLCGVLVGRGVLLDRGGAVDARALMDADDGDVPPPAAEGGSSSQPSRIEPNLVYPDRLEGAAQPADDKLATATPAEPPTAAPAAEAPPAEAPPATPPPAPPTPAAAPESDVARAPAPPAGSGLEIQVSAYRERGDADRLANRLVGKGYAAYVVPPASGAPVFYRVRVGKFGEQREADRVAARLKKEEKLDPWIVR